MSDNPKGKEGLARNIAKFRMEAKHLRRFMGPHWSRWIRRPWDVHAYVNLWVESCRLVPYLMGHIYCVLVPALVLVAILR